MPERRVIDPSRCWVRHVKRAPAGTAAPFRCSFDDHAELHRWRRAQNATDETGLEAADRARVQDGSVVFWATGRHAAMAPRKLTDGVLELDFNIAPTATQDTAAIPIRQTAVGAMLMGHVSYSSSATVLRVYRRAAGAWTQLAGSTTFAGLTAGDHRLRVTATGNVVTVALFRLSDGAQIGSTLSHTLAGADATAHGSGVNGRLGWRVEANSSPNAVVLRALTAVASTDNPDAWDVGGGVFLPEPLEGVNGRQGWQQAEVAPALGDDGEFTVRFPNAVGDDGRLHRDRFALLTDPTYRAGEEWIEFYREPHDCLFVGTPVRWKIDGSTLELSGADAGVLAVADRSGELDQWADPPQTVIEHYGRLTRAIVSTDFRGVTDVGALPDGWVANKAYRWGEVPTAPATIDPNGGGIRLVVGAGVAPNLGIDLDGVYADDYVVTARVRHVGGYLYVMVEPADPAGPALVNGYVIGTSGTIGQGEVHGTNTAVDWTYRVQDYDTPRLSEIRVVLHRRWIAFYVNGGLVKLAERVYPYGTPAALYIRTGGTGGELVVESAAVFTRQPILTRGAKPGTYKTPGAPTPGGLHGRYYDLTAYAQRYPFAGMAASAFSPLDEPKTERLDPTIAFSSAGPAPTWQPPSIPAAYFGVRWTGSIYLDLSGNGRRLRLDLDDAARVWVGHRRGGIGFGDPIIDQGWAAGGNFTDQRSADLRFTLGPNAQSGWYPIVIEYVASAGGNGLTLQESPLDGSGNPTAWTTVPATKLSPYGCVVDTFRLEPNREIAKQIGDAFGYQVVCEPRALESGEFPGQLVPYLRAGRDTDYVIDTVEGTQAAAEGDAGDAVDRLIVDAAGIADPTGSGQLSAEMVLPGTAGAHVFLATGYESLSEISERSLLEQRTSSLLALRGSPNEQVGVRPRGTRELADTFPLTGALARFDWQPGDGVRLDLPELAVRDLTPRQITKVSWPLYPDGVGAPSVGFRQRPRSIREIIRKSLRTSLTAQRNYQGGLTTVVGTMGSATWTGGADGHSRLLLPVDFASVVKLEAVVSAVGTGWLLLVNGVSTGITIGAQGRYDITRFLAREDTTSPRVYAHMTGGTSGYELVLQALVRLPGSP